MTTTSVPDLDRIAGADVIDADALRDLLRDDPELRVIDVRSGAEFRARHIPGSYNVPLDTLGEHMGELATLDHPVVLICASGDRATRAHGRLVAGGKTALHVLAGGLDAWRAAGGDVVEVGRDHWAMDRQVRLVAGSIVLSGILSSMAVPRAKWLAGGVGLGLVVSAVTNTCGMARVLEKLPYNRTDDDVAEVIARLGRKAA